MAFRIRRSLKLLPGTRLNFGKSGTSVSLGGRGATLNLGPRGVRSTVGLSGTGISYVTQHSKLRPSLVPPPVAPGSARVRWVALLVAAGIGAAAFRLL